MQKINRHDVSGISLLEMLLVMSILLSITIAAFIILPSIRSSEISNQTLSDMRQTVMNTKQIYVRDRSYADISNDRLNTNHAFPKTWNGGSYSAGTPIRASWGGPITVEPDIDDRDLRFYFVLEDVPTNVCTKLVGQIGGANDFERIDIGGVTYKEVLDNQNFDATGAFTACSIAPTTEIIVYVR
jgi:type II secretory pathway pseudopilin PulG